MRSPTLLAAAAALCLASGAAADQLIQIPTADLAASPKIEYKHRLNNGSREGYGTVAAQFGQAYELMFRYYNNEDRNHRIEGGGQFQLLPDGVVTPGVALGIWDITNSSPWGRRAFLVLTKGLDPGQLFVPEFLERVQLNIGLGTGRLSGVFAGMRVDLPARFSLVAEYDARRFNTGLWFTPADPVTLKAELQNGNPYFGGELKLRF